MTQQQGERPPLRRHSEDHLIGGVCAGLARTLGVETIVVRIIVALLALLGGAAVGAYVIAWVLIPDDTGRSVLSEVQRKGRWPQLAIIGVLALAGIALLTTDRDWGDGIGLILIITLAVLAWQAYEKKPKEALPPAGWASEATTTSPVAATTTPVVAPAPRIGSAMVPIIWSTLAIALGVLLLLDLTETWEFGGRPMIAVLLLIVGLGLIASAWVGRARGFIAMGILLSLLLIPAGVQTPLSIGDRTWTVSAQDVASPYRLGVGTAILDLTGLDLSSGQRQEISAEVAVGKLIVLLPQSGLNGVISGQTNVGKVKIYSSNAPSGVGQRLARTFGSGSGLRLDLSVAVGEIEVVEKRGDLDD